MGQLNILDPPKRYVLRKYQNDAVEIAVAKLRKKAKPFIIVLPTGAGKSLVIAETCHQLDEPTLILQPSKELVVQNHEKLESYGITDIGIYSASAGQKTIAKYTYATIGSIYKSPELFKDFKHIIMDECHLHNSTNKDSMYAKFFSDIGCESVMGLTATPYRMVNKFFSERGQKFYTAHLKMINRIYPFFFKSVAYQKEISELMDEGYLAPVIYRDIGMDISEIRLNSNMTDFDIRSLETFWKNDKRLMKLAKVIQGIDKGCKRNLVFCSSLLQAKRAKDMLADMGIEAGMVDGKTPLKERDAIVQDFRDGKFKHMINVGVFTTGFDLPALDCVVLARPTMSLGLYYQMVGRGVRLDPENPDKRLRVYDLAGVTSRLGRIETIKIVKEEGSHFKQKVISEAGDMTDVPLFKFLIKKKMFGERI